MGNELEVRPFTKVLLVGSIVSVAILAILTVITVERGWGGYLRLIQKGSNCEAIIIQAETRGNCLAEYTFSVGGHSYFGTGPQCGAIVGQKVIVTYLDTDPAHSCLGHAGERLANELVSFLFGGLFFPPLS